MNESFLHEFERFYDKSKSDPEVIYYYDYLIRKNTENKLNFVYGSEIHDEVLLNLTKIFALPESANMSKGHSWYTSSFNPKFPPMSVPYHMLKEILKFRSRCEEFVREVNPKFHPKDNQVVIKHLGKLALRLAEMSKDKTAEYWDTYNATMILLNVGVRTEVINRYRLNVEPKIMKLLVKQREELYSSFKPKGSISSTRRMNILNKKEELDSYLFDLPENISEMFFLYWTNPTQFNAKTREISADIRTLYSEGKIDKETSSELQVSLVNNMISLDDYPNSDPFFVLTNFAIGKSRNDAFTYYAMYNERQLQRVWNYAFKVVSDISNQYWVTNFIEKKLASAKSFSSYPEQFKEHFFKSFMKDLEDFESLSIISHQDKLEFESRGRLSML